MPYADQQLQREACRKHYDENKDYYAARNRRRREEMRVWIDSLKSKPCTDCGQTFPPKAMDWHHEGDKEFDIGKALQRGYGKRRILAEIQKCVLLCAVCHRLRD